MRPRMVRATRHHCPTSLSQSSQEPVIALPPPHPPSVIVDVTPFRDDARQYGSLSVDGPRCGVSLDDASPSANTCRRWPSRTVRIQTLGREVLRMLPLSA